jgi:hypothetical protein
MVGALVGAMLLALPRRRLERRSGWLLLVAYPLVAVTVLAR